MWIKDDKIWRWRIYLYEGAVRQESKHGYYECIINLYKPDSMYRRYAWLTVF